MNSIYYTLSKEEPNNINVTCLCPCPWTKQDWGHKIGVYVHNLFQIYPNNIASRF